MHLISSNSTVDPPTDRLQLSAEWSNTTDVRVTAVGDVDMSTARRFTEFVFRRAGNCRRLTLDMTQVTFFDCAGISALESVKERCGEANVALEIAPAQCVSRVMMLCEQLCA
ncbi:STAS domain-containing protein [Mycolicibacterium aichiense]|uniref:STAS domain-containing protein n=1 Tax=Mycolicibacterium aichiense TaxID=1799 RepID=A0AAD1HLZ5_9MYCO|nr:STAS domain-containing protein [Mycolicibacterium aichiense]BBX06653.1 hypothetical protein MAIC_14560 [Mycolicibacterium aichiense]STZ24010.1 anti-sigma-factor antagonist [Mycolicibacterium aichiense]